jgi:enterochelin esterase family protein
VPKDVRFSYLLRVNGDPLRPDPLNARHFGGRSVAESPQASPQPWIAENPGVPKGRLTHHTVRSLFLQEDRSFGIYTPPEYEPQSNEESLVIVFDGEMYGDSEDALIPTPRILDNLIAARRIPPTVALLVDNMSQKARDRDLRCSPAFEKFITQELLPWVRAHYRISGKPSDIVVAGSSDGGLFATFAALHNSGLFGNVLDQSADLFYSPDSKPALNPYTRDGGWLTRQFVTAHLLPLQFYLEVGLLEAGLTNPVAEHSVTYSEFSGGHDPLSWRNSFGDGLIALLGHRPSRR